MENWKKFLTEAANSNPDNLDCVRDPKYRKGLTSRTMGYDVENFKNCLEQAGWKFLASGTFRMVFEVPGEPNQILKITRPSRNPGIGMKMNKKEASKEYQESSPLALKVLQNEKNYFWIIPEKANIINKWEDLQIWFPAWMALVKEGILKANNFKEFYKEFIKKDFLTNKQKRINVAKKIEKIGDWSKITSQKEKLIKIANLFNEPMFEHIRDFLIKSKTKSWDVIPENVGFVIRNGKKQFVIVDPSYEVEIH